MTTPETRIRVELGERGYDVVVGAGILGRLGQIARSAAPDAARAFVVCDRGLPEATADRAQAALADAGMAPIVHGLRPSEAAKSLTTLEEVLAAMASARMDRREPVAALGGGIVGDVAGFAAAVYRRGVPVVQCPTTLLAMVDAAVGGKTGVNLRLPGETDGLKKNMVGSFHQPRAVVADVEVLRSLPERVFRAGLAECVKHGMIAADWGDAALLDWTEAALPRVMARDGAVLTELVARNVRLKAAVVTRDEREEAEGGGRALLNLGHTFAHAIETLPGLSPDGKPGSAPLQHGEAVALGLLAASRCAEAAGLCPAGLGGRVRLILAKCGLPTAIRGLPPIDQILALMTHDKKVLGGRLRLVLPTAPGRATAVADPPPQAVEAGIEAIRA